LIHPVRNFSPAIAGLETERGIISNGVNLSAEFNATTGLTSPFGKGGLRGIYLILNPPSPPFSKGGIMGLKTYRQLFVDVDSLSALTPNIPFIVFDPVALQKLDVFLLKRFSLPVDKFVLRSSGY